MVLREIFSVKSWLNPIFLLRLRIISCSLTVFAGIRVVIDTTRIAGNTVCITVGGAVVRAVEVIVIGVGARAAVAAAVRQ